jgi:hypothetical protein
MKYWVLRTSGPKGPFSETQIEGFIEAGRLPDGVQVSENQDGPWEPFTIANEDADVTRRKELWDELSHQMDLNAVDEALAIIDELATFDLPAEEKNDLDTLRRSLLEAEESHDGYADDDSYESQTRRRKKKTKKKAIQKDESIACPFPGLIVDASLSYFADDADVEVSTYSTEHAQLFGVGYCIIFAAAAICIVTILFKMDARISQLAMAATGLAVLAGTLTVLHFATHFALELNQTLMVQPEFRVASIRQLQIAICPSLMTCISLLGTGTYFSYLHLTSEFSNEENLATGVFGLVSGLAGAFIILKAILNPNRLGVIVDESATPAETFLGISALLARAPMACARAIYPLSMVLANVCAIFFIGALFFGASPRPMLAALVTSYVATLGLFFPLYAYVFTLLCTFVIELIQSIFDIRRNSQTS